MYIQISQFFNVFLSISPVFLGMSSYISNSRNNGWNGCIKGSGCVGIKRELAGKQYRAGAVDEMSLRHERIPRLHQLPRPPSSVLRMVQNFQEYLELPGIAQNSLKNASFLEGEKLMALEVFQFYLTQGFIRRCPAKDKKIVSHTRGGQRADCDDCQC